MNDFMRDFNHIFLFSTVFFNWNQYINIVKDFYNSFLDELIFYNHDF